MFKRRVLLIFFIIQISSGTFNISREWNEYKIKYRKNYPSILEEIYRKTNWLTNRNLIKFYNLLYNQNLTKFQLAINQFSDMNLLEFSNIFRNNISPLTQNWNFISNNFKQHIQNITEDVPQSIDWRLKGAVSPVRNQGTICSTSWAFASLSALESHNFIRFGYLPPQLSPQNLIDCVGETTHQSTSSPSTPSPTSSLIFSFCNKKTPQGAFEYIVKNQNVNTETAYPYEGGKTGRTCRYNPNNVGATCAGFQYLPQNNSNEYLKNVIGTMGPVIIGFDPTDFYFMHYATGIFENNNQLLTFLKSPLNHYLTVIGYTNEYWILKNSFGHQWGENGYIRISKKFKQGDSLSKIALYPIV